MLPDGRDPDAADEGGLEGAPPDAHGDGPTKTAPVHRSMEATFTVRQALKTRAFWQMALAMGFGQLVMSASIHQIPAITSFGFSRETAGLVMLAVSITSLIGRLGSGWVGDALDKRKVIAVSFAFQFIGTVIFANTSTPLHLVGFICFWGLGFGASIPARFALLADYFGTANIGKIQGVLFSVFTASMTVGPILSGLVHDEIGTYRPVLAGYAGASLLAVLAVSLVRKPQREASPAVAGA